MPTAIAREPTIISCFGLAAAVALLGCNVGAGNGGASGGAVGRGGRTSAGGALSMGGSAAGGSTGRPGGNRAGGTTTTGGAGGGDSSGAGGVSASAGKPGSGGSIVIDVGGSSGSVRASGGAGGSSTGGHAATGGNGSVGGASATGGTHGGGGTIGTGGQTATGGRSGTGGAGAAGGATACPATFENPVIWEDLADNDVVRVGDTFYYSASSFHFSPGAPILRSYDLVNWEYVAHSVPALDFNNSYSLIGGNAYNDGVWASSLRFRKSNSTWYWIGCMHGSGGGYMYTAPAIEGPWTKHATPYCYYDVGLLIDDDDTLYAAYGNTTLSVAQLSKDGLTQVKSQNVYTSGAEGALEGSRFYRIDKYYYIMPTQYANGEYILRASSPFGPYTLHKFAVGLKSPITAEPPVGGAPHQGSIVDTPTGDWYYMAFIDAYPGGRIPVLAPITWTDGWPSVTLVNGGWGLSYPFPKGLPCRPVKPRTGIDTFSQPTLGHEWEWNHNPDDTKWSSAAGLTLQTATVTADLYAARNTLTRRIVGPTSTATVELDVSAMKDGDVAGLAMLRQTSAWIGIKGAGDSRRVVMVDGLAMDAGFNTSNKGREVVSHSLPGSKVWLRANADITPGANRQATFSYSTNGTEFVPLGNALTLDKTWSFFMGYRFGIFNYATLALGGSVKVASFELTAP